jgi:putative PEP-CTERM system TPR-repeat lipoprotein
VPALLALAHLRESARAPQAEVVELLSKAVNAQPAEAKPRLMLVSYQLAKGNVKQALTEAQKATAALPDSIELLDLLGRAQLVSGDAFQAVNTFNRLASLQPQAPKPLLSLAEAYVAAGDRPAAQQSLRRALAVAPDFVPAQQRLIAMEMQATRSDAALKIARTMQAQHADSPAGFEVEGDIHAAGKKWDPSAAAYRQALKRQPSGQTARKLHGTLVAGGKRADAAAFAADWMKRNPKDSAFLFHLANMSIHARELPQAEKHLQDLVALEPDNAAALNNLAWTTAQLHKPGALEYSQKATRLVPNNAEYMDTMATILAGEKQLDKAVDVQKKAVALEPRNDALRLNLARLYVAAGEAELARKELDRLSGSGDKTPYRKEVQELRARL